MYVAVLVTRDHIVTLSCTAVCQRVRKERRRSTDTPLGETEYAPAVGGPLSLDEPLCASFNASSPFLVAHLEYAHDATARAGGEEVLGIACPGSMGDGAIVGGGALARAGSRGECCICWRGGGIKTPCTGDLKGVGASDDEPVVHGGEDPVGAGAEGDKGV